jgi:HSP20 family protein
MMSGEIVFRLGTILLDPCLARHLRTPCGKAIDRGRCGTKKEEIGAMALNDLMPWRNKGGLARRDQDPFSFLQREMNRLFDDFWGGLEPRLSGSASVAPLVMSWPNLDVHETEQGYQVTAEIPGLEERDIELNLRENTLTIGGEKKDQREQKEGSRFYTERSFGRFQRTIPFPVEIDADKVQASFRNGVLTIDLPKNSKAQDKTRRIPINIEEGQVRH